MELLKKTAVQMREALLKKEVSAVELVEESYKRVDNVEDKIGAYNSLTKEYALETAKRLMKNCKRRKFNPKWQVFLLH